MNVYTNKQVDQAMITLCGNDIAYIHLTPVEKYCLQNVPPLFVQIFTANAGFRQFAGGQVNQHNHALCVFRICDRCPRPYMEPEAVQATSDLKEHDISDELYREIVFVDSEAVYRIDSPQRLFIRPGGSTHRVVDAEGVAHRYPAPEDMGLTVIRWKTKDANKPVTF